MKKELIEILFGFETDNSEEKASDQILPCLEEIRSYLEEKGINCHLSEYDVEDVSGKKVRRANLLSYKPGSSSHILFQGHIDTVPFAGPYTYRIEEGKLIGRGSIDMKGSLLSMIEAYEELYQTELKEPPALLITGDEEAFSFAGIKHFLNSNDLPISLVINGEPSSLDIQDGFKGVFIVEAEVMGRNRHSSDPDDVSIIEKSIPLLEDIRSFLQEARTITDDKLGKTVAALTVVSAGNKSNQFPSKMRISFNTRTVKESASYLEIYNRMFNKYFLAEDIRFNLFYFDPMSVELSDKEKDDLKEAMSNAGIVFNTSTMRAFTESSFLNKEGYRTIICGPGDLDLAHTEASKEIVEIDKLERYKLFLKGFVLRRNRDK
jgi:acetylornithine deacetylase/succinyl-diaminopimelate desuccinylase-like protein